VETGPSAGIKLLTTAICLDKMSATLSKDQQRRFRRLLTLS
jgi:hypothetical protein